MHVGKHILNQREFNKDLYRSDTVKMHKVTKETQKKIRNKTQMESMIDKISYMMNLSTSKELQQRWYSQELPYPTIERDAKTFVQ